MPGSRIDFAATAQLALPDRPVEHLVASLTVISASAQLLARRARQGSPPSAAEIERTADLIVGAARQMAVTLAALDVAPGCAAD